MIWGLFSILQLTSASGNNDMCGNDEVGNGVVRNWNLHCNIFYYTPATATTTSTKTSSMWLGMVLMSATGISTATSSFTTTKQQLSIGKHTPTAFITFL